VKRKAVELNIVDHASDNTGTIGRVPLTCPASSKSAIADLYPL
jgi:hypothetical protein